MSSSYDAHCKCNVCLEDKYPQNNNVHFYDKRNQLVRYVDSNNNIRITKFKDAIEDIVYTNFDRIDYFLEEHTVCTGL